MNICKSKISFLFMLVFLPSFILINPKNAFSRKNSQNERISYLQNRRGNIQKPGNRFNFKPVTSMATNIEYEYDYSAPETNGNNPINSQAAATSRQSQIFPNFRSALTTTSTSTTPTTTATAIENNKKKLKSFVDFSQSSLSVCDCLVIRKEGSFNHTMNASLGTVSIINEQEPFNDCTSSKFDLENFQNTLMDLIEQVPEIKNFLSLLEITTNCNTQVRPIRLEFGVNIHLISSKMYMNELEHFRVIRHLKNNLNSILITFPSMNISFLDEILLNLNGQSIERSGRTHLMHLFSNCRLDFTSIKNEDDCKVTRVVLKVANN